VRGTRIRQELTEVRWPQKPKHVYEEQVGWSNLGALAKAATRGGGGGRGGGNSEEDDNEKDKEKEKNNKNSKKGTTSEDNASLKLLDERKMMEPVYVLPFSLSFSLDLDLDLCLFLCLFPLPLLFTPLFLFPRCLANFLVFLLSSLTAVFQTAFPTKSR
jgi:hypothetical protein